MSGQLRIDCEQFDTHADELALGHLDQPLRSQLLDHAADCPHCHSLLEGLGSVADRLLLVAPELEPSAGFENRVLARLDADPLAETRRTLGHRWLVAAAFVGVMAIAAGAFVALSGDAGSTSARAAVVVGAGSEVGSVNLIAEPTPHLLVTIEEPQPGSGIRTCELQRSDGTWEQVGWWDGADIASGVWAVGIDPALLDARAMRILADGDVVATATFD